MGKPLDIVILWHMHQPYYRDPVKGEYLLPWTYLHGVKDYYDMAAIVEEAPGAKVVFNLVPSLLEQIADYGAGEAMDPLLQRAAMEPGDMTEADRFYVLEDFFSANRQRMIEPMPRYLELLCLAGEERGAGRRDRLRLFGDQDILDLQVCFLLAWTGEMVRRRYPQVRELIRKGRGFSSSERHGLLAVHREVLAAIIPLYRSLHESGKAELSVTPAFHPILPLLCDLRSALTAMPKATLPSTPFSHPEDARAQVRMAVEQFTALFGFAPQGMWPSEGAVSDEALDVMAGEGIAWGATDEGVLVRSLHGGLGPGRVSLYQPYTYHARSGDLGLFFRDHALSDLIGFTYSQWDDERAVADFVNRLQTVRADAPGAKAVSVILDGENAWEYYADNGYGFLSGLYRAIDGANGLRFATCSEVLECNPVRPELGKIHPGSWINASYGIWIGHPEENRAWELLARARTAACEASPDCAAVLSGALSLEAVPLPVRTACRSLYAAEGSDWFWWYGDDHFSPHSDRFDFLFRRHLSIIYDQLGLAVPHELNEPIKSRRPAGAVREPTSLISPVVSGTVTDYFEWLGAGLFDLSRLGSAMHAAGGLLHSLFYGFDRRFFYLRLDGDNSLDRILTPEDRIDIYLVHGGEFRFSMDLAASEGPILHREGGKWAATGSLYCWKIARVCEVAISLEAIGLKPRDRLFATVTLSRGGQEVGRWPMDSPMVMAYAGPELELENWLI
jgi:alpha-amylase/alpha-mannosidase (GH57 family)